MKMVNYKCDCGGKVGKKICYFDGFLVYGMKCNKCGEVSFTSDQAKEVIKLRETNKEIEGNRKIIKVGSSIAALLPKKVEEYGIQEGLVETVKILSSNALEIRFKKDMF